MAEAVEAELQPLVALDDLAALCGCHGISPSEVVALAGRGYGFRIVKEGDADDPTTRG